MDTVDGNQKSGVHSPVEGLVVEIPLVTRFIYIPGGAGFLHRIVYTCGAYRQN